MASQVKTLLATELINKEKDIYSQLSFFNLGFVVEPNTWFSNIKSLKSGHYIIIRDNKIIDEIRWSDLETYWEIADENKIIDNNNEIQSQIKSEIISSVNKHLVSDVPIGIFLSSGLDSSLLASIASQNNKDNITAITVLFDDFKNSNLDETLNAKKITQKLGLKHFIFKVTEEDFTRDYPKILNAMDQPSIDGINVWYASKAAAKLNLKVVFSGLGGDEIFFGYDHFNKIPLFHKYLSYLRNIVFFKFILKFFFSNF